MTPDQFMRMFEPQPWIEQAACRGMAFQDDAPDFIPPRPNNAVRDKYATFRPALAVCEGCPVTAECAEYGRDEQFGVWGATAPMDRDPRRPIRHVPCDTLEGYWRHMREGSDPCVACKRRYADHRNRYKQDQRMSA